MDNFDYCKTHNVVPIFFTLNQLVTIAEEFKNRYDYILLTSGVVDTVGLDIYNECILKIDAASAVLGGDYGWYKTKS